jgi:hypothetical protein
MHTLKTMAQKLALMPVLSLTLLAGGLVIVQPATIEAGAPNQTQVQSGISATGSSGDGAEATVNNVVRNSINVFSYVVGVISVIMIMIGGTKYITSGGDASKAASAKNTILYAVAGIVVVLFAQVIVRFVVDRSVATT